MAVLDEHMVVRGRYVNAAREKRLLILGVDDSQKRRILQQTGEKIVGMTASVLDDNNGNLKIRRHVSNEAGQRSESTPRCSNNNDRSTTHKTFL
jgi:hypothetical protein